MANLIHFDLHGADNASLVRGRFPETVSVEEGDSYTIPRVADYYYPKRSAHYFINWNTQPDESGTSYEMGETFIPTSGITLYPIFVLCEMLDPVIDYFIVSRNGDKPKIEFKYHVQTQRYSDNIIDHGFAQIKNAKTGEYHSSRTIAGGKVSDEASFTSPTSLDDDSEYSCDLTVTDKYGYTASANRILHRAFFTLDFNPLAKAFALGSAAPEDGMVIGFETEIDGSSTFEYDVIFQEEEESELSKSVSFLGWNDVFV